MDDATKELVGLCEVIAPLWRRIPDLWRQAPGDARALEAAEAQIEAISERVAVIAHMARQMMAGRQVELLAEIEAMRRGLHVGALGALRCSPTSVRLDS